MPEVRPATVKERKWAVFVAGDEHIFFPALVSLASLEQCDPGTFDRFMVFNGERKTARMDELLAHCGITFLDARHVSALPTAAETHVPSSAIARSTQLYTGVGDNGVGDNRYVLLLEFRKKRAGPAPLSIIQNTSDETHGALVSKHRDLIREVLFSLVEDRPISHTQLVSFREDVRVLIP